MSKKKIIYLTLFFKQRVASEDLSSRVLESQGGWQLNFDPGAAIFFYIICSYLSFLGKGGKQEIGERQSKMRW